MKLIAPSILSADFSRLGEEIKSVEKAGADWIHVDVMDGHFVPNITMGPLVVEAAKKVTSLPIDVHLMIENADRFIPDFAKAGASFISVQVEACTHLNRTIQLIKELGVKPGIALNPATPLSSIEWVLEYIDFVLIMSVNPGFGGQSFIDAVIPKITATKTMISGRAIQLQVDGGINKDNLANLARMGVDNIVAGSSIFGTDNPGKTIKEMFDIVSSVSH